MDVAFIQMVVPLGRKPVAEIAHFERYRSG